MRRIPDWTSLDAAARQRWRTSARERASALNTELNAFVEIEAVKVRLGRTLDAMPYAAKDMLRTPSHQPSGGLAGAGELGIVGNSDLLDRLDEAGADRIGFTQMTELAYEPSGINSSRGRVEESMEPGPRPRRFVVWVGGGGCERCGLRRAWFGHWRLAPHPGALLRHHRLEADLWPDLDARRNAVGAIARHHRDSGTQRGRSAPARYDPGRSAAIAPDPRRCCVPRRSGAMRD